MILSIINTSLRHFKLLSCICLLVTTFHISADTITVNSISELQTYLDEDSVNVTMTPGIYTITTSDASSDVVIGDNSRKVLLYFQGSNSTFDFTGVTIKVDKTVLQASTSAYDLYELNISGNNNVLKNLTLIDDCSESDKPSKGITNLVVDGMNNKIEGFYMTVKGSYPYGYGDAFGKGSSYTIAHTKHCGILLRGKSNHLMNCSVISRAYGHCIFMQAAEDPIIEGCYVEGEMRSTDDMLTEEGTGSAADNIDFMTVWGYRLLPGYMLSCQEEGIRAYSSGTTVINGEELNYGTISPTVIDCTVKHSRGGITLSHASGTVVVRDCETIGCENGFGVSAGGIVENCTADVSYGPAFGAAYSSDKNVTIDLMITQNFPTYNGTNTIAYLGGSGHNITFRSSPSSPIDPSLLLMVSGDRNGIGHQEGANSSQNDLTTTNCVINNLTSNPIVLAPKSSYCTGVSGGMITDLGSNNSIIFSAVSLLDIEAEDYTAMLGVEISTTTDDVGGQKVSAIDATDWMEYEITVPSSGTYSFEYRVSGTSNGDFTVEMNEETIDTVNFAATAGDEIWETVHSSSPIYLNEGHDTIRITSNTTGWNLNWIKLQAECYDTPITPYIETANSLGTLLNTEQTAELVAFPGITATLMAEVALGGSWSWSGPNDFFSDEKEIVLADIQIGDSGDYVFTYTNDCGQQTDKTFTISVTESLVFEAENYTQMSGILTESCTDVGNGEDVTQINTGDWIEFEVDVPFTANFYINYRIASESTGGSFTVSSNETEIDNISFDATGSTQSWQTVSSSSLIRLNAGQQTIRISSTMGDWSINWFELKLDQMVSACSLPFTQEDEVISNETFYWSSGAMDITCEESVSFFANVSSTGALDASDYLNIYYKLDGGELIPISECKGAFNEFVYVENLIGKTVEIVIEGYTTSTDKKYTISNQLMQYGSTLLTKLEAEDYDAIISGTDILIENCSDVDYGSQLGYVTAGDWCMFRNIDLTDVSSISVRYSSQYSSGTIQVRLGSATGTIIGTIPISKTSNWITYASSSTAVTNTTGLQNVYFVFSAGFNINWFELTASAIPSPSAGIDKTYQMDSFSKISLYPNPVSDKLNITNAAGSILEVYNSTGQKILKSNIIGAHQTFDFKAIKAGIYIIKVIGDNNTNTSKIIKRD